MASISRKKSGRGFSAGDQRKLLEVLRTRFHSHPDRHTGVAWSKVEERLIRAPDRLQSLRAMEESGGEPDVVSWDRNTGEFVFFDCSAETPSGRRGLCYDRAALESRRANKPKSSAMEMAESMGIEILDESEYRNLQKLGVFDSKTSSWVKTPDAIRSLGGALFCDHRFGRVFTYHNGAESYYAVRGFRGSLRI